MTERGIGPEARRLARDLAEVGGSSVGAILLYGSRLLGAGADRHSAYDFVVVVDAYTPFYRCLRAVGATRRPPWLLSLLAHVLPPNVIAYIPEEARGGAIAKCVVVSRVHLERAMGPRRRDHFLVARLLQRVAVVYARHGGDEAWLENVLQLGRRDVLRWMAPFLHGPFDAHTLGRRILEVCYASEVRPEAGSRAHQIFLLQAEHFQKTLEPVLEEAVAAGLLTRDGDRYRLARRPSLLERVRVRAYFLRSKTRATLRWFKYVVTFDNWLPYVVRKAERHSGERIRLTRWEERLPLIFLWPRAVRFLIRARRRRAVTEAATPLSDREHTP